MWDIAAFWAAVLKNPPNPDEPLPLSNRPATIYASNLVFLVLSWIALSFRLWVRFRVVREPGWDDLFVVLASLCNVAGSICVCLSVQNGLGKHMLYLGLPTVQQYLFLLYLEKSIYMTEATFIKLSLLLQYLRIFKSGVMRLICIVLVAITSLWGLVYFILGWFPCFPIRAAWERTIQATCYGFGYNDPKSFTEIYVSHASSNLVLDLIIFVIPLVLFSTPNLNPRNLIAMAGMFFCGAVVVGIAIARLYVIVKYRAGTAPYIDLTWWAPNMIILSVLEIDLAIICACMPIFWPIIEKSLGAIFVSFEVEIVEEHIDDHGLAYKLEHRKGREGSIKSGSGVSTQELIRDEELGGRELERQYSISRLNAIGVHTAVQGKQKPRWEI